MMFSREEREKSARALDQTMLSIEDALASGPLKLDVSGMLHSMRVATGSQFRSVISTTMVLAREMDNWATRLRI